MAAMVDTTDPTPSTPAPVAPAWLDALGHSMADKRIEVLRRLALNGSISQAARDCGISYKAAWQALDTLTNLAGITLVERSVGGAGGGGATLTDAGHTLLRAADAMEQARLEVLARLQSAGLDQPVLARLAVRTSMRNQWPCTVQALEVQGSRVRVQLRDAGTQAIALYAHVTRESAELLGLAAGMPVLAMAKATAVQVADAAFDAWPATDATLWSGTLTRVEEGEGREVAVRLAGGLHIVGFMHDSAADGAVGDAVQVRIPAAAVVLALVDAVP